MMFSYTNRGRFFYLSNDSIKWTILLNKRSYWTIVHWENERNFENEQNQFLFNYWKKEQNGSFTSDKRTKWKKVELDEDLHSNGINIFE